MASRKEESFAELSDRSAKLQLRLENAVGKHGKAFERPAV
jgi:hypothetical protein